MRKVTKINMLGDYVLVKPFEEETEKGGIIIAKTEKEKLAMGEVITVGKGLYDNGDYIPMDVKQGDVIYHNEFAGLKTTINDEEFVVLKEHEILMVIELEEADG